MVYVHIPFCRSFCTYCGFYSEIPDRVGDDRAGSTKAVGDDGTSCIPSVIPGSQSVIHGSPSVIPGSPSVIPGLTGNLPQCTSKNDGPERGTVEDFVEALCRETVLRADEIRSCKGTGTLYIGGGTPSILSLEQLGRIVRAVREALGNDGADVSATGNPADGGEPSGNGNTSGNGEPSGDRNPSGDGNTFKEFTVEVNPDDIVRKGPEYVKGLMRLGVNRISMGVQSFDNRILHRMNRRHNASDAVRAYRILRECGLENISIDLIFGFPADFGNGSPADGDCSKGPSADGICGNGSPAGGNCRAETNNPLDYWKDTLQKALEIGGEGRPPEHISAYQLSIEEGSALEKMVADGRFTPLSDELCSAQYDLLCSTLSAAGYNHYEISNFALPGKEAVHNSAYWNHTPYVGLGPGAHSFVFREPHPADIPNLAGKALGKDRADGFGAVILTTETGGDKFKKEVSEKLTVRRWNIDDVKAYIKAYCHCTGPLDGTTSRENYGNTDGDAPAVTGEEILTAEQLRTEQIMLSLRTSRGIPRHILETSPASAAKVRRLIDCGSLVPVSQTCTGPTSQGDLSGSPEPNVPRLRIPENRFFISDDIIAELI